MFDRFRHGYAGTIYKGQGRTLDQTYLYHSEHWRSAASYVALTRHRESAGLFVATNTAPDVATLARQMARVDERRAASQFHVRGSAAQVRDGEQPERPAESQASLRAASSETSARRSPDDQNQGAEELAQLRAAAAEARRSDAEYRRRDLDLDFEK